MTHLILYYQQFSCTVPALNYDPLTPTPTFKGHLHLVQEFHYLLCCGCGHMTLLLGHMTQVFQVWQDQGAGAVLHVYRVSFHRYRAWKLRSKMNRNIC